MAQLMPLPLTVSCMQLFNGPLSGTTQVSWYQKGKTNLNFLEVRDSEWQWHQLGHTQACTSLHTDNYASTPPLTVSCFSKIQIAFNFLVPAHQGSLGQRAIKRVCMCV